MLHIKEHVHIYKRKSNKKYGNNQEQEFAYYQ